MSADSMISNAVFVLFMLGSHGLFDIDFYVTIHQLEVVNAPHKKGYFLMHTILWFIRNDTEKLKLEMAWGTCNFDADMQTINHVAMCFTKVENSHND